MPVTGSDADAYYFRIVADYIHLNPARPGGRSHDSFPVNSYEAESRRLARFFPHGHSGGKLEAREAPISPDFPFTLDLRMMP